MEETTFIPLPNYESEHLSCWQEILGSMRSTVESSLDDYRVACSGISDPNQSICHNQLLQNLRMRLARGVGTCESFWYHEIREENQDPRLPMAEKVFRLVTNFRSLEVRINSFQLLKYGPDFLSTTNRLCTELLKFRASHCLNVLEQRTGPTILQESPSIKSASTWKRRCRESGQYRITKTGPKGKRRSSPLSRPPLSPDSTTSSLQSTPTSI